MYIFFSVCWFWFCCICIWTIICLVTHLKPYMIWSRWHTIYSCLVDNYSFVTIYDLQFQWISLSLSFSLFYKGIIFQFSDFDFGLYADELINDHMSSSLCSRKKRIFFFLNWRKRRIFFFLNWRRGEYFKLNILFLYFMDDFEKLCITWSS